MQVHFFNDHIYELHSHAVARNPIFTDKDLCQRFLEKVNKYLSPLCEILHYTIQGNQFRILIKLRSRNDFIKYYGRRKQVYNEAEIPFTTHIFSQAMSNLLASTAIHFNRKFGRTGALFSRRFFRRLVRSEVDFQDTVRSMDRLERLHRYCQEWGYRKRDRKWRSRSKESWLSSAKEFYCSRNIKHPILQSFHSIDKTKLRGQFKNLPPKSIYSIFDSLVIKFYISKPPDS